MIEDVCDNVELVCTQIRERAKPCFEEFSRCAWFLARSQRWGPVRIAVAQLIQKFMNDNVPYSGQGVHSPDYVVNAITSHPGAVVPESSLRLESAER